MAIPPTNRIAAWAVATLSITGCVVGPDYARPLSDAPPHWHSELEGPMQAEPVTVARWWQTLGDPVLTNLIERAETRNLDLKMAAARLREARAARGVVASDRLPHVGFSSAYRVSQSPEPPDVDTGSPLSFGVTAGPGGIQRTASLRGRNGTVSRTRSTNRAIGADGTATTNRSTTRSATFAPSPDDGFERQQDVFSAGFDATWELDVFGGIARAVEAADASIDAETERLRNVYVTLASEVALNYIDYRTAQARIDVAQRNIDAQAESARLTRIRFDAGLSSEFDTVRAEAQLATFESRVPTLQTERNMALHRLSVLLDTQPAELTEMLADPKPLPTAPEHVPVGLPSDLLQRRPDIRAAERDLAAATARIGIAVAEQFPRFTLTGNWGVESIGLSSGLLDSANQVWSIGPGISWPIFEGNRIRANIEVQNARQEQSMYNYEQIILLALEEVENGLVSFAREQDRRASLAEALTANQRAVRLANERYTRGLEDFLSVLTAQAQSFESEDLLLQSQAMSILDLIALYKALGGGWEMQDKLTTD